MKPKGISLVEITVVLAIITLLTVIAIPLFNNYQKSAKLKSEARVLAANLRLAQQLAITEQVIYRLKLFPETRNYKIIKSPTEEIVKSVTLASGVRINEIDGLTDNQVQFTTTGGVIETGQIALTNTRHQTSTIQIKPSGYVQINE
ncbi:MAG: hypothetical protein A2663_02645 [Candidatus Buchananbacteria bacterium RIFCSPHIGHO2_01_FULL_46_12]|nr:MAG: hypothetical protein A2663_02645 [Candidatus Buchananbacteria bacterium RIFCSPHIGHO2_01_FULL_46_12]OGY52769.1 MAG: hypothetical protein A3B15_03555 [Candidatus Buchananbacteria bacterium RIFCSPLOWO2_01_FULL_45_31]